MKGPKKKVLYVEDIPANRELVRQILKSREDIDLLSASTGREGIAVALNEVPDLILMDIHLPDMDGLTAFKELRRTAATRNIPVIALTADAMAGDVGRALKMGFRSYITKPIDVPGFLEEIDFALS